MNDTHFNIFFISETILFACRAKIHACIVQSDNQI